MVDRAYEHPLETEERASYVLAGGLMLRGHQCGMLWGSTLAAGAEAYRRHGAGPAGETRALMAASWLADAIRRRYGGTDCIEITGMDMREASPDQYLTFFLLQGGPALCMRMALGFSRTAIDEIDLTMRASSVAVPDPPVNCAALMARRLGLSDMQTVMAAGLAGGIGLSGAGCGALGTALWAIGLGDEGDGRGKIEYEDPRAQRTYERFSQHTGSAIECTRIVGRRFDGIADHARYVRDGGCADILDLLTGM